MSSQDRRLARLIDLSARAVDRAHLVQATAARAAEAAQGAWAAAEDAYRSAVGEPPLREVDPYDLEAEAARRGYLRSLAERRQHEAHGAKSSANTALAALVEARIDHAKLEKFGAMRAERVEAEERRKETRSLDDHAARLVRRSSDDRESR